MFGRFAIFCRAKQIRKFLNPYGFIGGNILYNDGRLSLFCAHVFIGLSARKPFRPKTFANLLKAGACTLALGVIPKPGFLIDARNYTTFVVSHLCTFWQHL